MYLGGNDMYNNDDNGFDLECQDSKVMSRLTQSGHVVARTKKEINLMLGKDIQYKSSTVRRMVRGVNVSLDEYSPARLSDN